MILPSGLSPTYNVSYIIVRGQLQIRIGRGGMCHLNSPKQYVLALFVFFNIFVPQIASPLSVRVIVPKVCERFRGVDSVAYSFMFFKHTQWNRVCWFLYFVCFHSFVNDQHLFWILAIWEESAIYNNRNLLGQIWQTGLKQYTNNPVHRHHKLITVDGEALLKLKTPFSYQQCRSILYASMHNNQRQNVMKAMQKPLALFVFFNIFIFLPQ